MQLELALDEAALAWRPAAEWAPRLRDLVAAAGPGDGVLEVVLTGDPQIRQLNLLYRRKDRATDVLSFSFLEDHSARRCELLAGDLAARSVAGEGEAPASPVLVGQVVLSADTVRARKVRTHWSHEDELIFLTTHGLLHVLGYHHDDEDAAAEMQCEEARLLGRLDMAHPHSEGGESLG